MAAAWYTASYAYEPPHKKSAWYAKASEEDKRVFDRIVQSANLRASQTGKTSDYVTFIIKCYLIFIQLSV